MAEAQAMEVQKQKVVGFAKRNTKEDKIKEEEKEKKEWKTPKKKTEEQPVTEKAEEHETKNTEPIHTKTK